MTEWLYPVRCPVCLQIVTPKGASLHPDCIKKLLFLKEPVCKKCGIPLASEDEEYCQECFTGTDRGWEEGRSVFPYHSPVENALWQVKREGIKEFVLFFGFCMYKRQGTFIQRMAPECIVPVPLHSSKQRSRGFNQAELLAVALGQEVGLPVRRLLKKIKKTKDQKNLSKHERRKNLKDAFVIEEKELGKHIPQSVLLVDDVYTTGSTLTACAMVLRSYGVDKVVFLSVCAGKML